MYHGLHLALAREHTHELRRAAAEARRVAHAHTATPDATRSRFTHALVRLLGAVTGIS